VFEDREKTVPKRDADSSLPLWAVTMTTAEGGAGEVMIAAEKPPAVVGERVTLGDLVARAWEVEGRHGIAFRAAKLVPFAAVTVQRARPEGVATKTTKSGKTRLVPLADVLLPYVRKRMKGRGPDELLFPPLHRARFIEWPNWGETGQGRTIHDLRHTAVCIWLASGVKPGVVKSWAGHASLTTTDIYVHHLGTEADAEGLALLNQKPGAHRGHTRKGGRRSG